jgi:hypothetical protein
VHLCTSNLTSCENEARLCLQSPVLDSTYQDEVEIWHSACDSFISFSVTTPAISSMPESLDYGVCGQIYLACESGSVGRVSCASSATATTNLLSCLCQPRMTSLFSSCDFDANVSCYGLPGNTDGIPGHAFCSEFQSVTVGSFNHSVISTATDGIGIELAT